MTKNVTGEVKKSRQETKLDNIQISAFSVDAMDMQPNNVMSNIKNGQLANTSGIVSRPTLQEIKAYKARTKEYQAQLKRSYFEHIEYASQQQM